MIAANELSPIVGFRVLICVLGLDQHEAGSLAVARILQDRGAEVVYAGRFNLPDMVAAIAVQEDVDVIGISCHSWEFLYYAEELASRMKELDPPIPVILGGSVVTETDRADVLAKGIDEAVLPGAGPDEIFQAFRQLAERDLDTGPRAVNVVPSSIPPRAES